MSGEHQVNLNLSLTLLDVKLVFFFSEMGLLDIQTINMLEEKGWIYMVTISKPSE